jgi:hypothetical protein
VATLTFTGAKYQYLHDVLVKAGYPPVSVFVNGTIYTVNFETQAIADAAMVVADAQCTAMDKHARKTAVDTEAEEIKNDYRNAYIGALGKGNTAQATAILGYIKDLNDALYSAKEAIDNE